MIRYECSAPLRFGDTSILVVQRLSIQATGTGPACWINATRQPYAVLLRNQRGWAVIDLSGRRLTPDEIDQEPAIRDAIRTAS